MNFINFRSSLKSTLKLILLVAIVSTLGLGVNYVFAQSGWQGPPNNPPDGGIDVPVNVGEVEQTKNSQFTADALRTKSSLRVDLNVGIGLGNGNEPAAALHINQGNSNSASIQLGNDIAGEGMHITKTVTGSPFGSNALVFWGGKNGSGTKLMTLFQDALFQLEGQIKINGGTPGLGKVLTSDATGLASWQDASSGGGDVTGAGNANWLSKWTSTKNLTNSQIFDNGTNVGVGTSNPNNKLHVNGDINVTSANGVYKWGNLSGLRDRTCPSGQTFDGVSVKGGIVMASGTGTCVSIGGGSGGVSGSGTTNRIPLWTGSTNLGNSIISQSGSNINVAGTISSEDLNLGTNSNDGLGIIKKDNGSILLQTQSGFFTGSITLRTDQDDRLIIREDNNNASLNGLVDILYRLRVRGGSPAAGKILTSVDNQGLSEWRTLNSMAVTSITAGAGITTNQSTGNVTVGVAQGTWCGFSLATGTGDFDDPGDTIPPTNLCQGLDPVVNCPSGYYRANIHRIDPDWAQGWVCMKN